jgi:hypothetical protein
MVDDVHVDVRGHDRIAMGLVSAARQFEDMRSANWRVSEVMRQRAQTYCPVRTGRLQASIHSVRSRGEAKVEAGKGIPYARVQHYGWPQHNIKASLFLTKALNESVDEAKVIYGAEVTKIIEGIRGA